MGSYRNLDILPCVQHGRSSGGVEKGRKKSIKVLPLFRNAPTKMRRYIEGESFSKVGFTYLLEANHS